MSRILKTRVAKLEARNKLPRRIRSTVARFAPDGSLLGPMPTSKRIMVVTDFGTDAEWQAAVLAQQQRLVGEAKEGALQ